MPQMLSNELSSYWTQNIPLNCKFNLFPYEKEALILSILLLN